MKKKMMRNMALALMSACMLTGFSMTGLAMPEDLFACTTSRDDRNDILVDFKELQITLPASWSGKCQVSTAKDSATFYHLRSRERYTQELGYPNGGLLFQICYSEELDFMDLPSYETIADTDEGHYYVCYPTDLQGYANDESILTEFQKMSGEVEQAVDSLVLKEGYAGTANTDDYILPQTSTSYISSKDLTTLTGDEIQMAINEIYARHHRKFVLPRVQDYFDQKSWYDGYIEAADFDPSVMNQYESANVGVMVKYMNDYGITSSFMGGESSPALDGGSVSVLPPSTATAHGSVTEKVNDSFRIRQSDGSAIQFWFDPYKLSGMGDAAEYLAVGALISLTYDTDTYEAIDITVEAPASPYEEEYLQCPYCAQWFSTQSDGNLWNPYDRHVLSERDAADAQTEQEMAQCPDCGNWYETGNIFRNHICEGRTY